MTKGQRARRLANLELALGVGIAGIVNPFLLIAAPGFMDPTFGFGNTVPTGLFLIGGELAMLVGLASMIRIWRASRDPEPERFRTWRYRSR